MARRTSMRVAVSQSGRSSYALTFIVGLTMAVLAISALLELRSRMMVAFGALGTINVLQATRARSVAYLIDATEGLRDRAYSVSGIARPPSQSDRGAAVGEVDALRADAENETELKPFVDKYVNDANAVFAALQPASPDAAKVAEDLSNARQSSDALDLTLSTQVAERRDALQRDISRMVLAVAGLIAGVVLVSMTQGWELLSMGRRLFTTQNDSAEKIASLSTTLIESQEALARMNRRLTLAMQSAHVVVFSIEPSGTVTWSLDAGSGVFGDVSPPFLLSDLTPQTDRARVLEQIKGASKSRDLIEFEMRLERANADLRWVKVTLLPLDAEDENGLLGSAVDITDIKRREEGNVLLMRELSHRSKNLLAVVQAMARQTARTAPTPVEFYDRFGTRLRALAAGHDLLVKNVYVSAGLQELIHSQLGALAPLIGSRVFADGPSVRLRPEATQNLGMALHELAANAQIHGAMMNPEGRIEITWQFEGSGADRRLTIDWVESGGPGLAVSTGRGFGSTLILQNLPRALHGTVTLDHLSEGTRCHMELPLNYLLEGWKPKDDAIDPQELST
jgi:two-component sensor histidine kinase